MNGALDLSQFEPVAAQPAAGGGLDMSQFEPVDEPSPAAPSALEAGLRGVYQGGTLGFGDEISGALTSAFSSKTYQEARDEARAANKTAQEAHPWAYGAGQVGGGIATMFVPGLNVAKSATVAAAAGRAALTGAAAGLGSSEAELAGPERDVGQAAMDTGVGAGLGALFGAAGQKLASLPGGAQGRVDKRLLSSLGDRAPKAIRDKIAANAESIKEVMRARGLDKLTKEPQALEGANKALKQETGAALGEAWKAVDAFSEGAPTREIIGALRSVKREYAGPVTADLRRQVDTLITETIRSYGKDKMVPLQSLNKMVTQLENKGFSGMAADPGTRKELQRKVAGALEDVLQNRLKGATSAAEGAAGSSLAGRPAFAGAQAAADAAKVIPDLNKTYRATMDIGKAASYRAKLEPFSETGLRSFTLRGLAEKVWNGTAGKLTEPADIAMARIVKAAKAGNPRAVEMVKSMFGAGEQGAAANASTLPGMALGGLQTALAPADEEQRLAGN